MKISTKSWPSSGTKAEQPIIPYQNHEKRNGIKLRMVKFLQRVISLTKSNIVTKITTSIKMRKDIALFKTNVLIL